MGESMGTTHLISSIQDSILRHGPLAAVLPDANAKQDNWGLACLVLLQSVSDVVCLHGWPLRQLDATRARQLENRSLTLRRVTAESMQIAQCVRLLVCPGTHLRQLISFNPASIVSLFDYGANIQAGGCPVPWPPLVGIPPCNCPLQCFSVPSISPFPWSQVRSFNVFVRGLPRLVTCRQIWKSHRSYARALRYCSHLVVPAASSACHHIFECILTPSRTHCQNQPRRTALFRPTLCRRDLRRPRARPR